jgi:hypothetical protein
MQSLLRARPQHHAFALCVILRARNEHAVSAAARLPCPPDFLACQVWVLFKTQTRGLYRPLTSGSSI